MARRKKSGTAGDLLEIVALLPWWGGVALAVVSYLGLNHVATQPAVAPFQPGQVAELMTQSVFKAFAMVGQYAIPLLCLLGAVTSAWRRSQRQRLVAEVTSNPASDALEGISWREFETLVGESFRRQGFRVMETGGGGPDGGVDLVLRKPGKNGDEKFLVQCKQWRAYKVGVDVVRELYGVMAASGAAGGFVVTSGRFTDEAAQLCKRPQRDPGGWGKAVSTAAANPGGWRTFFRPENCSHRSSDRLRLLSRLTRALCVQSHGSAHCQTRRQRRQRVLGLHRLSDLPWHAPDQLSPRTTMALPDGLYDLLIDRGAGPITGGSRPIKGRCVAALKAGQPNSWPMSSPASSRPSSTMCPATRPRKPRGNSNW
jgi:HJR/Mrr/RecB family endonuclease